MKIAMISKSNAPGGGASRFAEDLAGWLNERNHECHHYCGKIHGTPRPYQRHLNSRTPTARAARFLHRTTRRAGFSEFLPLDYYGEFQRLAEEYDVLHFQDHFKSYSLTGAALASRKRPVFFTAHDCLHFSGGCVYPAGCDRFKQGCGKCPQAWWMGRWDGTRTVQRAHRLSAERGKIQYLYPSRWLLNLSQQALQHSTPPEHLPYGFDHERYAAPSREEARQRLGISTSRPVICIGAHYFEDPRKGTVYALRAIQQVRQLQPLVLCVGEPSRELVSGLAGVDFWMSGFVASPARLAAIYAAADLFLSCALEDNLPITIQEMMASSTATVGFASGGVPELIRHGNDGWLVPTRDESALQQVLTEAVNNLPEAHARGRASRLRLLQEFTVRQCVDRHLQLYREAQTLRGAPVRTGN
jgi:glycosyltransferase involved in cell wall biosynthesis